MSRGVLVAALVIAASRTAAQTSNGDATPEVEVSPSAPEKGPDVELHVPRVQVAKLALDVENLQARLDLDTSVGSLVHVSAGLTATVQKLKMELEQVETEAHLVVRLERVTGVMERALATIEQQPQLGAPRADGNAAVATPVAAADPALPELSPAAPAPSQPLPAGGAGTP